MTPSAPIVVALSGGVDSATAAAMLVAEGRRVIGITMRLYDARGTEAAGGRCCGPRDIEDARRVCEHLGVPFYVVDFAEQFERAVIDDFASAYLRGETPNPCVRCNQHIKFAPLLRRARALGADRIATGHYARLVRSGDGRVELHRGVDARKDQSYFLFSMPEGELEAIDFPLGHLDKEEVRARARELGLPNASKADSQEICFVPDGDYAGFVEKRAAAIGAAIPIAGDIVDEGGRVLGRHRGIHRYTIGQRRGLGELDTGGAPIFVVRIDRERNQVVVGPRESAGRQVIDVVDLRWLGAGPGAELKTTVQVRHRAQPVPCRVVHSGDVARVELDHDVVASPGQAAVFYDGDRVRGGGWISPASNRTDM